MPGNDHHETDDFNMPLTHKAPFPTSATPGEALVSVGGAIDANPCRKAHLLLQAAQDLQKNKNKPLAVITLNKKHATSQGPQ